MTGSDAEDVFGFSLNPPPNVPGYTNVSFLGTGDIEECINTTEKVFDFYNCSVNGNCDSGEYAVPPAMGRFVVSEQGGEG